MVYLLYRHEERITERNKSAVSSAPQKLDAIVDGKYYTGKSVEKTYQISFDKGSYGYASALLLLRMKNGDWGKLDVEVNNSRIAKSKLTIIPEAEAKSLVPGNPALYRQIFDVEVVE